MDTELNEPRMQMDLNLVEPRMDTDSHGLKTMDLTEAVIGSAFEVANVLGAGFLEKVYERAIVSGACLARFPRQVSSLISPHAIR